jgi:Ca2+:H+ antiporter
VVKRVLFTSVGLAPVVILLHYALDLDETVEFVLSAAALIPLAWLIGEATEHAAEHTGPGIGGFLNATFGNAPELIIALLAVHEGLTEVVRGSLTGSVIGNLLLVLGFSLLFGGRGEIDRQSSFLALGLVGVTTLLLLIPAIPGWDGDPERDSIVNISVPVSIVLLLAYLVLTWYSLRRHAALHIASDEEIKGWSLRFALVVLGAATVLTAVVAEILVGTLEVFAHEVGLTEFFVAAVIVAIVGNAAEHWVAVLVAAKNKMDLAVNIAVGSSAQIALVIAPILVLASFVIGPEPMPLVFNGYEIGAMIFAVLIANFLTQDGESNWFEGVQLLAVYAVMGVVFFFA